MSSEAVSDRLVSVNEAKRIVGLKSHSAFYCMIRKGELPPLIRRGRNSYYLESDLRKYLSKLASTQRRVGPGPSNPNANTL